MGGFPDRLKALPRQLFRTWPPAGGPAGGAHCDSAPRRVPFSRPSPAAPRRAGGRAPGRMLRSLGWRAASGRWLRAQGLQWRQPRHLARPGVCTRPRSGVATWASSGRARTFRCCQTWGCGAGLVAPAMAAEEEAAVRGETAGGRPRGRGGLGPALRRRPWPGWGASSRGGVARWARLAGGSPPAPHHLGVASEPRSFLEAQVRRSAVRVLPGGGRWGVSRTTAAGFRPAGSLQPGVFAPGWTF